MPYKKGRAERRRRYRRFHRWMLNGHPGNVTRGVKRVIVRIVNHGLVVSSTTDGSHSPTSWHFTNPGRAVDAGQDWTKDDAAEGRRKKVRLQKTLLRQGRRKWAELFGPDNVANVKNGVRITLVEGSPLETLHDTHVHAAPRRLIRWPRALRVTQQVKDRRLARKIAARYSVPRWYALMILQEARRAGIPPRVGFALLEKESGFRNVWGGDPAPNGGTSGWRFRTVTKTDYLGYKRRRGQDGRGGMQGVGPAQLTWYSFQDDADRAGGCWRPRINTRVAFGRIALLVQMYGWQDGFRRYNGSGSAAEAYARDMLTRCAKWKRRLAAARG